VRSDPPSVPSGASGVTAEWLHAALRSTLPARSFRIASVEPAGTPYGLASERVRFRLAPPASPSSVVVKLWSFEDAADAREVHFYHSLAPRSGARVLACHHADLDERAGHAVLVLEDLEEAAQGDCLEEPTRDRAIALGEALAAVHASWWERPELRESPWLPEEIGLRTPEWLASRTPAVLERFGDRLTPLSRELLAHGERLQLRIQAQLRGSPWTLLHGDLHLDNVLFEARTDRPVLLDWSRVARGSYILDLADLLFGVVGARDRESVIEGYVRDARSRGAPVPNGAALRRQLGAGLLRYFFRSTCGVARWRPGSERESRMIDVAVRRAMAAVAEWREQDQDLFLEGTTPQGGTDAP
jgi:aminoglycoside/choline kinase family phosphotransferase